MSDSINRTIDQRLAEEAFICVKEQENSGAFKKYCSFALSFPSLIHTCGLTQALAFAQIKKKDHCVLADLARVLTAIEDGIDGSGDKLIEKSRLASVREYMRLSRRALMAASWIKRWCQAYDKDGDQNA